MIEILSAVLGVRFPIPTRAVDLMWAPVRIAAVSGQIYWATWHQVFRYPRGDK